MNIKDIAKLCGVSPSTVSKILNNKDSDISAETRKKVLSVIREYQYVPYSKVLKNAAPKTSTIGIIVSDTRGEMGRFLFEAEPVAMAAGYSTVICNTEGDPERLKKYLAVLEGRGVDGILAVDQDVLLLEQIKLPVVAVCRKESLQDNKKTAEIYCEQREAACLAVNHLFEKGHTRIGCILLDSDTENEAGYLKAFMDRMQTPNMSYVYKGGDIEEIKRKGITTLLNMDITAVICGTPEIAGYVYGTVQERGGAVPEDLSVISVRDNKLAEVLSPQLTAVTFPLTEIAGQGVRRLVQMMEENKPGYSISDKINLQLLERGSVIPPSVKKQGGKIVVVGSMNMDYMISVPHIPVNGETVLAGSIKLMPGGKGGNQAIGAGKLGGLVYLIGCLGSDMEGNEIYNSLAASGVKMSGVISENTMPTGKAYIHVPAGGESTITVHPGANRKLDRRQIKKFIHLFEGAKYCLISSEIQEDAIEYTIKECKKQGVEVIVKPSALEQIKDETYQGIDFLIPNKKELEQLVQGDLSVAERADILYEKGVNNVIVTMDADGCYLKNRERSAFYPAADFPAFDTTGAADAFISALAVCLSEGNDLVYAIGFATYAAGISITRPGVQSALADRMEIDMYNDDIHRIFRR